MPANEPKMSRREAMLQLLRLAGAGAGTAAAAIWLSQHSKPPSDALAANAKRDHTVKANAALPEMVVVQGDDPRALVRQALLDLGGIERFIARNDVVVLKPNIAWDQNSGASGEYQSRCSRRDGSAVLARGRQAGDCHRCQLQ